MSTWMLPDGRAIDDDGLRDIVGRAFPVERFWKEYVVPNNDPEDLAHVSTDELRALYTRWVGDVASRYMADKDRVYRDFGIMEVAQ